MIDSSEGLDKASLELGVPVEQLFTPSTRRRAFDPEGKFGIDNGAFSSFSAGEFVSLLDREMPRRELCRFVAVPDVVGDARRTLECFESWEPSLRSWPIALVAQDGQEHLPIPWCKIAAIFIGGSTEWKMSKHSVAIIKCAQIMGKWVHVGRVNTPGRYEYFKELGVDSIDGTGLSRYSWMRKAIYERETQPTLMDYVDNNKNLSL